MIEHRNVDEVIESDLMKRQQINMAIMQDTSTLKDRIRLPTVDADVAHLLHKFLDYLMFIILSLTKKLAPLSRTKPR